MNDDINPLQSGLPEDLYQLDGGTNPSSDISAITSDLEAAENIADNVDTDVALDIVTCQQECLQSLGDCNRCVNGQIEGNLRSVEDYLDRFQTRIVRPIQEDLSNVISLGTQLGIPITELLSQTATPDAPDVAFAEITRPASFVATIPSTTAAAAVQPVAPATPVGSGGLNPPAPPVDFTAPVDVSNPLTDPNCPYTRIPSVPAGFVEDARQTLPDGSFTAHGYINGVEYYVYHGVNDPPGCQYAAFPALNQTTGTGGTGTITPITPPPTGGCVPCPNAAPATGAIRQLPGIPLCDPEKTREVLGQVDQNRQGFVEQFDSVVSYVQQSLGFDPSKPVGITDYLTKPFGTLAGVVVTSISSLIGVLYSVADSTGFIGGGCSGPGFSSVSLHNGLTNLFGGWFGLIPDNLRQTNQYALNLLCPYKLPSAADANTLWNQQIVTDDQWRLLVEANGYCPEWQKKVREALSPVPTVDQVVSLVRRGAVDPSTSDYYFKRLGVKDNADKEAFFALSDFIPGPSDLVSFMTRDVFDPAVVESEKLDDEFEDKFQGAIEQWAAAQGMDAEQFRYYWRAHWRYPSPEQLAEFVHRLRPTDRDPDDKYADVVFTVEDFKRLMRINDYAPEHIDEYLATTYRPLSRVDARRAFEIGAVDEGGLYRSYLDLGYAPDKARALLDFARLNSGPVRAKKTGAAGTAEVLKWFRERTVTREQAEQLLIESGVPDKYVSKYLRTEELRRTSANRKEAMVALRKRYMAGEFSAGEISAALSGIGVDPGAAGEILFQWQIVRDAKYKGPTVSMLCEWFQRGMIDMGEFQRRVDNMGYSHVDAQRIVQTCLGKRQEHLEKEAEKAAKEAAAREAKRIRDLKAAQKDAERAYKAGLPCTPSKPKCKPGTVTPQNGQVPTAG